MKEDLGALERCTKKKNSQTARCKHKQKESRWQSLLLASLLKDIAIDIFVFESDDTPTTAIMSDSPLNKKQKVVQSEETPEPQEAPSPDLAVATPTHDESVEEEEEEEGVASTQPNMLHSMSRTPRKLVIGSTDNRFAFSQPSNPTSSTAFQVPSLQPPSTQDTRSGRKMKSYSQSPPRSPGRSHGRSPVRKLELIQLSPIKNSRAELQKLYSAHNQKQKNEARLYINKLVMNDFKSYAGRQVVGPFNTSFSAVVGPNGSGKSNVIDSMLFVFGFRANKMRQDRLADLIHKSEKHPNLPSCSIEVHFQYVLDLPDGSTKIDTEKGDLVITRRAFRNNSSKYYINGKESNYKAVTELLKQEGIDLDHKRFLILQGEVENIAQMKAKAEKDNDDGLLEYLEDIIGTTKYKPLIEQNMAEMEALNDVCIEKENRFEIVDREKNSLEKDKDAALEYLNKEKQLTLATSKRFQLKIHESNQKMKNALGKISDFNSQLEKEQQKFETQLQGVQELKNSHKEMNSHMSEFESKEKTLNKEKREMKSQEVSMEEMMKSLTQKKKKAEKSLKTTEEKISENETQVQNLEEESAECSDKIKELDEQSNIEKAKLEDIKISLKDKTKDISADISKYEKELEPWNVKIQEKALEIQITESEISVLKETQIQLEENIRNIKSDLSIKAQSIDTKTKTIEEMNNELVNVRKEISIGESECANAKKQIKDMLQVLSVQRQRASEARSALSTVQNKNKVLTALSRLEKSGRITGFHGRLGDLGVIAKEYDIAISTASPRLDDIVVETVECGQQCIEHLRKNKLGYARFILLDKLRKFNTNKIQTPDNSMRLFDLVQPKHEMFVPAFYSVLRDTLVTQDLKQANRVAYGKRRYRVVTLDGKLIDISGTMSGGGNQVSRGLMQLGDKSTNAFMQYSPEDVQKIESDLEEREKNFQIANDTFHEMDQEVRRMKDKEPQIELESSKLSMDIDSLKSELVVLNKTLEEKIVAYSHTEGEKEEITVAEMKLEKLKEELSDLKKETHAKEETIAKLKDEIMKIGGIELQLQNSKVCSLVESIELAQKKLKKCKSDLKKKDKEMRKCQKSLKSDQSEVKVCDEEFAKVEQRLTTTKEKLSEVVQSLEEILNEKDTITEKIEELKEKIDEFETDNNQYQSFKLEIENKLEKLNNLANYVKKEIKQDEGELFKLKIRDVTRTLQLLDEGKSGEEADADMETPQDRDGESNGEENNTSHSSINMNYNENSNSQSNAEDDDMMNIDEEYIEISKGIPRLSEDELTGIDKDLLDQEIGSLEEYINTSKADIDILEEYVNRLIEYKKRKNDLNNAIERRDEVTKVLEDLKSKRYDEFMEGFSVISMTLKEMYQMITMGGNAELELVDSLDPFSEGVTFSVMPPKKSWRNITNLSGGEKTLSSLALVFALHKYKPTPLYVMDEIDAALDFRNVSIVANYIKERTKNAQFIVISLRNNMFELAQQLVGIYKRDNMTKSVTLQNEDIIS